MSSRSRHGSYSPSHQVNVLIQETYDSDERYRVELQLLQHHLKQYDDLYQSVYNIIKLHNSTEYLSTPENRKRWAIQADVSYSMYIKNYRYNPYDLPQVIYLFKRPLAKLRLMARVFKVCVYYFPTRLFGIYANHVIFFYFFIRKLLNMSQAYSQEIHLMLSDPFLLHLWQAQVPQHQTLLSMKV